MILHGFCSRSLKSRYFNSKTLIFYQKSKKYHKNLQKYQKILGFLGFPWEPLWTCGLCCSNFLSPDVCMALIWGGLHLAVQNNVRGGCHVTTWTPPCCCKDIARWEWTDNLTRPHRATGLHRAPQGSTGLHRAPQGSTGPQGSLGNPRKPRNFCIFLNFWNIFKMFA